MQGGLRVVFQGVVDVLCEACEGLKWYSPTPIQREALPLAFQGTYTLTQ